MEEVSALVARCDSCDFSGFHIAEYGAHYIYRRAVRPQVEPFRKPYARQRKKKKKNPEAKNERKCSKHQRGPAKLAAHVVRDRLVAAP